MFGSALLTISTLLQFLAAILALRLIKITGRRWAWSLIAAATLLMAVRRSVTLFSLWQGQLLESPSLTAEGIALVISVLMLIGIAGVAPIFHSVNQAAQDVRESEARLRQIIDLVPHLVSAWNLHGEYILANQAVADALGTDVDKVPGQKAISFDPSLTQDERLRHNDAEVIRSGQPNIVPEEVLIDASGKERVFRTTKIPFSVSGSEQPAVLCVAEDITERKRLEEQLRQAQKMEAIGHLAGGIAHDFNNILTAIIGYTTLIENRPGESARVSEYAHQINYSADQAAILVRQLLAFGRRQTLKLESLDLNDVIKQIKPMLERLIDESVSLEVTYAPKLPMLKADPGQLEQVVMNLIINARDALPRGGKIVMETRNFVQTEEHPAKLDLQPGRYIELCIQDNGFGMDADTLEHIFEPFFTTKEQGKGTGLGLATVFGIVKQCGGRISADAKVGKGSTFKVYFPAANGEEEGSPTSLDKLADHRGGETTLLVEDDALVRDLAFRILDGKGYRVLVAGCANDAISLAHDHGGAIDILVTDIVMPDMRGTELAKILKLARSNLRVLFISGYAPDVFASQGMDGGGLELLAKPFAPAALTRRVREILDRSTAQ